jgi:6-phosphogluconolactonase/glucosamine-6-phosphate isomerase/deaminase
MSAEICIEKDEVSLYRAAAQRFAHLARQTVERKGRFCVALAGG